MERLKNGSRWMSRYLEQFTTEDPVIAMNFELKQVHTQKVVDEALSLARSLGWKEEDIELAGIIARFHDLARFEQFLQFRTFSDRESRDHGDWGARLFDSLNVLSEIQGADRELIRTAIRLHNKKALPSLPDSRTLSHCRLIRDADKIDIFRVVTTTEVTMRGVGNPDPSPGEETPAEYRSDLVDNLLAGIQSGNEHLNTRLDLVLLQLGWLYDINYAQALETIVRRGYFEQLLALLPPDPRKVRIEAHLRDYLKKELPGVVYA